ncbi:MAG: sigma-70 family RNA polymerase sigma factor [Prolixibacteraceae bacterium]|nr:sigma-70 family RNA polymerase sigma factor [Prolixibacteraceae bacterium]
MTAIEFNCKLISLEQDLHRFAYKLTADREEARDLVQETFLKALKYCSKYAHENNFKAWAYTILKNTFINSYRQSSRHNTCNSDTYKDFFNYYSIYSEHGLPDSEYCFKELEKVIDALQEEFKLPFKMYFEGFRYHEIADKLNIKIGTVKSRIHFARNQLREQVTR